MKKSTFYPLFALTLLLVLGLACGDSTNQGSLVTPSDDGESENTATRPVVQTYNVGDLIEVGDTTVTMNSVEVSNGIISADFTIENLGSSDHTVSTLLDFEARADDGTSLEQEIFDCEPSLGGTILPGDKIRGKVCYSGATNGPFKIYYRSELFGSGAVVWQVE